MRLGLVLCSPGSLALVTSKLFHVEQVRNEPRRFCRKISKARGRNTGRPHLGNQSFLCCYLHALKQTNKQTIKPAVFENPPLE